MRFQIYPYNNKSKGAKALMAALGSKMMSTGDLQIRLEQGKVEKGFALINWGAGSIKEAVRAASKVVLNPTKGVNICADKVKFFEAQAAAANPARIPVFTTDFEKAMEWVQEGIAVMGRTARGSCGLDIVFYEDDPSKFQGSDFWVQYKKKKEEYRIHIVRGNVIATQKKSLRTSDENGEKIDNSTVDFRIRNHRNGFIFKRNDLSVPGDVVEQAILAFTNVGLDFGAVDVIWNQYEGKAYVLEINTAPGLEGTTVSDYAGALKEILAA